MALGGGSTAEAAIDPFLPPLVVGEFNLPPAVDDAEVVIPTQRYKDRLSACTEAILSEPEFGIMKTSEEHYGGNAKYVPPPLTPYVKVHTVKADGKICGETLVQRRITLFLKVNNKKLTGLLHLVGNGGDDRRSSIVVGTRKDQCGKTLQAGVLIEADMDGRVDGFKDPDRNNIFPDDISRVYLSPEQKVICKK